MTPLKCCFPISCCQCQADPRGTTQPWLVLGELWSVCSGSEKIQKLLVKRAINYQVLYRAGNPTSKGKQGPVFFSSQLLLYGTVATSVKPTQSMEDLGREGARGKGFARWQKYSGNTIQKVPKMGSQKETNSSSNSRYLQVSQKTRRRLKLPLALMIFFNISWSLAIQERWVAFVVWGQDLIGTGFPLLLPNLSPQT